MKIEIEEAGPFEWGLIIDGKPARTWWKSEFLGKPDEHHPKIQQALKAHEQYLKDFPSRNPS